jgi:bifunctional oligoribonuclease and PAP phosphatase NrnA
MSTTTPRLTLTPAIRLIQSSRDVYLATHIRPDGDALGSLLGLALALEATGHRVARLCSFPVPPDYDYLPGAELVTATPPEWPAELGIVVDTDGLARVGEPLVPVFESLPHLIDIDHHATEKSFGEVRLVDSGAAATAEVVYDVVRALSAEVTPEIATCFYTALLTDTGRFAFTNTDARAFQVAADLAAAGADPAAISTAIYFRRSFAAVRLMGVTLGRMQLHLEGQAISSLVHLQDFVETGAVASDTEGIIDHVRAVHGPRVSLLLVENEGGEMRVSLRSDGTPNVSRIALRFGGGGHAAAAGCTVPGPPEEARQAVLAAVHEALLGGTDAP